MKKWFIFLVLMYPFLMVESSLSFRCDKRIVSIGDRKLEVFKKCGEPALRDRWKEKQTKISHRKGKDRNLSKNKGIFHNPDREHSVKKKRKRKFKKNVVSVDIEEWMYNLGSRSFLYFLRFENGSLVEIGTGDYGYDEDQSLNNIKAECRYGVSIGDRKLEILTKCGKPTFGDEWQVERGKIDQLIYNFGSDYFIYFFRFENGKLIDIQTGIHGYDKED